MTWHEFVFEWDTHKAISNLHKHGVDFETARLVFLDPCYLSAADRIEAGEQRWQTLGEVAGVVVLLVAHTVRLDNDQEVVRLISARAATKSERKRYEQYRAEQLRSE